MRSGGHWGCWGLAALLVGCGASDGTVRGEAPTSSEEELLGFERDEDWLREGGAPLGVDGDASQGARALLLRARGLAALESRAFSADRTDLLTVDLRIPEQAAAGVGKLVVSFDCPSRAITDGKLESADLDEAATGRFETIKFELPEPLREALSRGCADLRIRLEIATDRDLGEVAFDRVRLGSAVKIIENAECGVPQPDERGMEELPNGFLRRHSWRSGASVQQELARFQRAITEIPGVLGLAVDDLNRRFIVRTDPEATDSLETIAESLARAQPTLSLAVQPSCRSGSELSAALDVIEHRQFHSRAANVELAQYFDAEAGQYVVFVDPDDRDVGEALEAKLGTLVEVRYERIVPHGRESDGEPHYGAANLENLETGRACTAGFVVNGPAGRGAVTAGHCYSIGQSAYSGAEYYGEANKLPTDTNSWDMVYLAPDGETFSPKIHTTPCCPSVRTVTSKTAPVVTTPRQLVCISGRNFLAKCSVEVIQLMLTKSIDGKARKNVWIGRRTGVNIAKQGDSGAPLYIPLSMDRASIVGMHIGGLSSAPYDQTWFHSVGDVESKLGVTVAF